MRLRKIRIGIVDDQPIYREGMVFALSAELDMEVVGQGDTAADAFRIAVDAKPHVLIVEPKVSGTGINAISKIANRCPSIRLLVLTVDEEGETVRSALMKGAHGYLLKKTTNAERLVETIRLIDKGETYISPTYAAEILLGRPMDQALLPLQEPSGPGLLSERESAILSLIGHGLSNKRIGAQLDLTEKTVKGYVTGIIRKLGVDNRLQAAMAMTSGQRHQH